MWMKSTPLPRQSRATDWTTWTTGPHVRVWQKSGVANVTTNGRFAAIEAATVVRRRFRSGGSAVVAARTDFDRCVRLERRVSGRDGAVADLGCGRPLAHDEVAKGLNLLATGRPGENPVLPGRRRRHGRHVDVLCVGLCAAGYADRLEGRGRLGIRLLPEPSRDPDARLRRLDQLRFLVDDEERDAVLAGAVVGRAGNHGDGFAPFTPERLQGSWRRCSRRGRVTLGSRRGRLTLAALAGASAPAENERTTEKDEGRSRAVHRPSLAAVRHGFRCVL